jgi:hypothetical protein
LYSPTHIIRQLTQEGWGGRGLYWAWNFEKSCSKELVRGPYPEPNKLSPHPFIYLRPILKMSSHQPGLPDSLFRSRFPTKIKYAFIISQMCATWYLHQILFDSAILILFGEESNYEAPHYAIFSGLLSLYIECFSRFWWNSIYRTSVTRSSGLPRVSFIYIKLFYFS